jgi:hypothetical protein
MIIQTKHFYNPWWKCSTYATHLCNQRKVRANIDGNVLADKLTKDKTKVPHSLLTHLCEKAHSTPYHLLKDNWPSVDNTPYKGPICHLQEYNIKYDRMHTLELTVQTFPNINKWTSDESIDIKTSTNYWNHPLAQMPKKLASSNFNIINTWTTHASNYSLA